jgi:predicted esterase
VVRTHQEIVLSTLARCSQRFSVPASRSVLIGFSQPVGLNYRLIASHPAAFRGVIGICGGIPRDWEDGHYHDQVPAALLLHIARNEDEYYSNEIVAQFPDRLRLRASDVEFHLISGPHRFPSSAASIVLPWMERVFGGS